MPVPGPIPFGGGGSLRLGATSVRALSNSQQVDFGQDIAFLNGLDPRLLLVGGLANLGQALVARLSTPRGGLFYDPNYGTDLRVYVNDAMSAATLARVRADVQAECIKDERVLACTASTVFDAPTKTLLVQVSVQTAGGPFQLVLAVSSLTVAVLRPADQVG